ncbi:MAG: hypothetical protein HYZ67_10065, partial [Chlamydiae bacterium]|nr:hypothetical protein [Chlamydiota bacterium]
EEMPIFIHQVVPIVQVRPDDYVFSLNEETGKIELHRIMGLMDMGVKPVFRLTTASGRSIRTTANHPYLKRIMDHGQEKDHGSWMMDDRKDKNTSNPPSTIQDPSSVLSTPPSTIYHPLSASHWTPVSRLHIGDKIAVPKLARLDFFESLDRTFNDGKAYEQSTSEIEVFERFFCFGRSEPFVFDRVGDESNSSMDLNSQLLSDSSSSEIISEEDQGSLFKSYCQAVSFTAMKMTLFKGGFQGVWDRFRGGDDCYIGPFFNDTMTFTRNVSSCFFDDTHWDHDVREVLQKGQTTYFFQMDQWTGVDDPSMHSDPTRHLLEQPDLVSQQVEQVHDPEGEWLFGGRVALQDNVQERNLDRAWPSPTPMPPLAQPMAFHDGAWPILLAGPVGAGTSYASSPFIAFTDYTYSTLPASRSKRELDVRRLSKANTDILWDRIQSIELTGFERVYDIEVEGTHNFIGNGIVAHNTYITSLSPIHAVGQSASPPSIKENENLRDEEEKGQVAVEYILLLPLLIPLLVLGLPLYMGIRLFWSRRVRVPAQSLSPSNLRAYQNLLIEIDPENESHYETCAGMAHAFEALPGGTLACVRQTGRQFFLGQSGRVIINQNEVVGLSVLAHEYAHADPREPLPAFVTGGSFAELFESIYRRLIADEVQAFEAEILFAKKFKEKRNQSLWDLPSESGVKSMMVGLEAIYDEQGRQGIQTWLERGHYLTYKLQALKMAALFRAGALDKDMTNLEPLGQGGEKIERDLIEELWNALRPQLTQNPLGVLNLSRQPGMKRAIRKFWDVSKRTGALELEDIDFLRNDFDKVVTFVGVLFGEPVPETESSSEKVDSGSQQVIHPLFNQPSQSWYESSQGTLDETQAENHLARWQFLAQYKILASVLDSVGVMEALLPLVSSQDQKRILSDLYERVQTEPLELYHVAKIGASHGYLEASHELLERAFQHPENFPLRVGGRSLSHLLELLEIFDQRRNDEGRKRVIALLTQYVERRGLDDWIYTFRYILRRPFKENEVDELRAHGKEVMDHSWIAMNPERIHEILGWEPKDHYRNFLISDDSFKRLESLDSALKNLEVKPSLSSASSQAVSELRARLKGHLSHLAMASKSDWNKLSQSGFGSPDFYQGLPPLQDLKLGEDRFSNYVHSELTMVSLSSSHPYLENLKHFCSFKDVLKFLSQLDPLFFHAPLFTWVGENLDQWPQSDAARLIQVWEQWVKRAHRLSARFHYQGYTKFYDQQMFLQGLSSAYQSLSSASSFLQSPEGMHLHLSLAEGWLKSSDPLLKAKAGAILEEVQSKSAAAFWSPRGDYDTNTYFFSQHTGFWIAKAWLLDGIQGSGGLVALNRAYDILSNPSQRLHTAAQVSEWIELLLDLALAFEREGDFRQRAACEQAAYNYVQEMDRLMRSEDFRARDSRYNNKPKKSDALLQHLQMTYQKSQAVYRTKLAIQQNSRQALTTGLAPQGEFKDYSYRQFLAMARELSQAHWNLELIQVLERMIVQVRARSGFEIEGEQNIVSSIQTFFEEENSFVQVVLNASLSPLEKDDWILRYAQAVIGEEESILAKGDISSLARVARGFEPLLKAVRDGKCPRSEAFLLKNLAEALDDLKATYPNLVEGGVQALAPLVRGLEESHPELLQSGKREAYQALLPENQALRQALDVLFPAEDGSEITRLSQNLYEEAMEALKLKMQLEGFHQSNINISFYTRLSLDELTGLKSFAVLRGKMTASSDGPLDSFLENPKRVREVLIGEPPDSMRAQVFSPLLREIFLKSGSPEVRAMAVQGLIVAGYLGSYAEHLFKKNTASQQNLYRILEAVAGEFASPIPDELFALYDESSPAIPESSLKNLKFIEYIRYYNKSSKPLLIHVDSLAPTIQDPQAELLILTVFSHYNESWLQDYTQDIVDASKTLKTRLRVKMFLETTTLPKPLQDLPETLKFVFAIFLFQNPDILSRFNAYCRENSKLSQGDLLCAFFRMAHAEKLAQALANWPGLLPPPLQEALAQTQQDNEPISELEFLMDLNEALGGDYRDPFSEIDWSSRKVGSVAEVVRAKRKDTDKWVAIKLIPSRRMKRMERHLEGMEKLFEVLSLYKDEKFRGVDPALFGKEYIRSYRQELDLRNEAKNVSVMQPVFQRIGQVRMPKYQSQYTRPRLLVMSWEEGTPLKALAPDEVKKAVEALSRLVIDGIFQEGEILDDLHSDNIRWDTKGQKLIVWDFGRLSTITEFDRDILLDYLSAIYQRDANGIIQALQKMADP